MNKKTLLRKIEDFLSERRQTAGGWAEITNKDVTDLKMIVSELIELKCERDPDGDMVLEFEIIDRRKEFQQFHPMPYPRDLGVLELFALQGMWMAYAKVAMSELEFVSGYIKEKTGHPHD